MIIVGTFERAAPRQQKAMPVIGFLSSRREGSRRVRLACRRR
jgi:hypothetical protein